MSATAAVAIAAAANSAAIAAQQAAERAECRVVVAQFRAEDAAVAAMQQYARCVEVLHPAASGMPWPIKVAIVLLILSVIGGAIYGYREDGVEGAVMYASGWACLCFVGLLIALGIAAVILG